MCRNKPELFVLSHVPYYHGTSAKLFEILESKLFRIMTVDNLVRTVQKIKI